MGNILKLLKVSKTTKATPQVNTPMVPTTQQVSARNNLFEGLKATNTTPIKSVSQLTDTSKTTRSLAQETQIPKSNLTQVSTNPVKSIGSNIGKYAVGAGIGAIGLGLVNNKVNEILDKVEETPDPEPQYPIDPYHPNPYQPTPPYVYNPESGELIPYPYFVGGGEDAGGTAYLTGDGYGDNGGGSVSIFGETIETLRPYAPYLIGFVVVVVIIALIAGRKGKKGKGKKQKKGGNRK